MAIHCMCKVTLYIYILAVNRKHDNIASREYKIGFDNWSKSESYKQIEKERVRNLVL